jgi:hypothetical protein
LEKREKKRVLTILRQITSDNGWPGVYINSDTGKPYKPHKAEEAQAVYNDSPRYVLLKGGEGGGKSVAGIIKTLERLRRGMNGAMISPDLVHFQKSLWPEFRRWCPWDRVVEKQRYRQSTTWEPTRPFSLVFNNAIGSQSVLLCGGAKESEIGAWEGPNLSFCGMDEFRRHRTAAALKVLDGRVRIPGPNGEPPQIFITTTPRKHWLFEYFGPLKEDDPRAAFKADSLVVTLLTTDNAENLEPGFAEKRAQTLTAAEARVLLKAEWEDIDTGQRFLPSMLLWDACKEDLPALSAYEPMVIALDAAVVNDCFAMVGVTRHPIRDEVVAVRFVQVWEPKGHALDYQGTEDDPGPERVLRRLADEYNVMCVVYDPYQLHDMATRLGREGVAWFKEFGQGAPRLESDQQLLALISQKRLAHDGNATLRQHIDNADRKLDDKGKLRIVKREDAQKIDAAVAAGMAAYQCLKLRIG